ncbi:MAG: hypothetical protein KDB53_08655 [Planctomycetes bacterium]|nr:hypothetical protein [Planctomycetota bacterium]
MLRTALRALVAAGLLVMAACSSTHPGGSYLYDEGEPPKLLDSEIKMVTHRKIRGSDDADLRILKCRDGQIIGKVVLPRQRQQGEVTIPLESYARIWAELRDRGFELEVEPADPAGGYYHLLTLKMGQKFNEFSAQDRTNFLGFGTQNIQDRMELANAFVRFLNEHVTLQPMPPEAVEPAGR